MNNAERINAENAERERIQRVNAEYSKKQPVSERDSKVALINAEYGRNQ